MPPKPTVTRENVLEAALETVRAEGLSALSARSVAQRLGCSTQPIYRIYSSMEELRAEVLERAHQLAARYLAGEIGGAGAVQGPFLRMGMGSLHFAREEPQLFKAVGQEGPVVRDILHGTPLPPSLLERMRNEPPLAELSDDQLARVHRLMWFFSQGLATLFFSPLNGDPMEQATALMMEAGRAVIAFELNQAPKRRTR